MPARANCFPAARGSSRGGPGTAPVLHLMCTLATPTKGKLFLHYSAKNPMDGLSTVPKNVDRSAC